MHAEGTRRHKPASWVTPGHILASGGRAILMKILQDFLDKRELQRGYDDSVVRHSADNEVIVDYVADTGDGFTATYSVFRQFNPDAMGHADMLVFGGDQVYPMASSQAYREKFTGPLMDAVPADYLGGVCDRINAGDFEGARALLAPTGDRDWHAHQVDLLRTALRAQGREEVIDALLDGSSPGGAIAESQPAVEAAPPAVLAIPGNHDWYDGLTAFSRLFMEPGTRIGGFETVQSRSYWAVDVTVDGRRWWLWGVDMALDADIDRAQLDYFENCGAVEGEPVVLCVPAPLWTYAEHRCEQLFAFERSAIFERGLRLALVISGDRHYYTRRESGVAGESGGRRPDAPPRITAGIGGAFKQPPHLEKVVPMLWEAEPDRHGRPKRTLPYVAAELPGGVPFRRDGENGGGREVTFPGERESRKMVGLRHSFAAWWRWNRSFTMIPLLISLLAATTTLQSSLFWRQDADFSETSVWQLGSYFAISSNVVIALFMFGVAYALAAPDPGAHLQRTQRTAWTFLHGVAQVAGLWGSMWAGQEVASRWLDDLGQDADSDRVLESIAFIGSSAIFGAFAFTVILILYFWLSNKAQMSINVAASWNLEQNHVGFVRFRFTRDAIIGEVHGITDVKIEDPDDIWRDVVDPRGTQARVEPNWDRDPLVLVDRFEIGHPLAKR